MRWRLLSSPPLDGPANMALDHALMERARRSGESVLRVYAWSAPVLSLGRNQRALGVYDDARLADRGITVVRRPTGGRALLHHHEITYSVTMPARPDSALSAAYRRINALVLQSLASLGVAATLAQPVSRARAPTSHPCFSEPARGEIVADGRKLVGSAQWRDDGALLQHGSILVEDDQSVVPLLMLEPAGPARAPATLRDLLGRTPEHAEVASALFNAVRDREDSSASLLSSAEVESIAAVSFVHRYRDPDWTWRR